MTTAKHTWLDRPRAVVIDGVERAETWRRMLAEDRERREMALLEFCRAEEMRKREARGVVGMCLLLIVAIAVGRLVFG